MPRSAAISGTDKPQKKLQINDLRELGVVRGELVERIAHALEYLRILHAVGFGDERRVVHAATALFGMTGT